MKDIDTRDLQYAPIVSYLNTMTKREIFAGQIMAALIARENSPTDEVCANWAVYAADLLIEELNK